MNKFVRHLLLSALVLVTVMVGGTLAYANNNLNTNAVRGVPMSQPVPQFAKVDGEWDRSSVSVTGACVNDVPTFYVSNTGEAGEGDMDAPTTWRLVDADGNILASGTIQVAGGDTQTVSFPEYAGQTVRLYVDQRPGHPGSSNPNHVVENCGDEPTPTEEPTEVVTEEPTEEPTEVVTEEPTEEPTEVVTEEPTEEPTEVVTEEPTEEPTEVVTEEPTEEPTPDVTPTEEPTVVPAVFDAYIECNTYGGITYTVYLVEGEMAEGEYYPVYYTDSYNWDVNIGFVEWLNDYNSSISFEVYDVNATTFWVEGLDHLTRSIECWDMAELSVGADCYDNAPTFYIYNVGNGNMTSETEWSLYDSYGNWLTSGSVYLYSGDVLILSFPEYADIELTMYVQQTAGYPGDSYAVASIFPCVVITEEPTEEPTVEPTPDVTEEPTQEPTPTDEPVADVLESYIECNQYGGITFTVYLVSGELTDGEYYAVYYNDAYGWAVNVGFVEWLNADTTSISFEVYDVTSTTFWVEGYENLTQSIDCGGSTEEPETDVLESVIECNQYGGITFTVYLVSGELTEGESYAVYYTNADYASQWVGYVEWLNLDSPSISFEVYDVTSTNFWVDGYDGLDKYIECVVPTEEPTEEPTVEPTPDVTEEPTEEPTPVVTPTEEPTEEPTPVVTPTEEPTEEPTPVVTPTPTPDVTPEPEPVDFVTSATCANNGNITFTVTYTGTGAMAQGESYTVSYTTDDVTDENSEDDEFVVIGSVSRLSESRPTATFTVRRMSGETVTFVVDGMPALTTTVECWDKSSVSVSGQCVNGVPVFDVNNTGTEGMTGDTEWRLIDVQTGDILTSGTIRLGGNETQQLSFEEYAGLNIRLYVDQRPGHPGSSQPNASLNNCANS